MSEHTSGSLESALAAMELELDTAIKAAGVALRQLKKGRTAAQGGSLRDMERALEASAQSLAELAEKAQALRDSFDFDAEAHMEGGAYLQEVLEALVDLCLLDLREVELEAFQDLCQGGATGPQRQEGQGHGDTQRGEHDILIGVLQSQLLVEAEGEVGVAGG